MLTRDDVESLLLRLDEGVEEVEAGMWVLGKDGGRLVIHYSPPLLLLRVKVMEARDHAGAVDLYRRLLELNATDMIHGAYGIEEGDVVLSEALELERLDFGDLQAAVDSMQVAIASHLEPLRAFREG